MFSNAGLISLLACVTAAFAASQDVLVGPNGFVYSPNSTTAAKGDTVVFHFYPGSHNVVQGDFHKPCSTAGGFYSGFISPTSGVASETFTITINDTNPIWIYCSAVEHCQTGMVMVINPPTSGDTLAAYAAASAKTSSSTTPGTVQGGVVSSGSDTSSSSSLTASSVVSSKSSSSASASSSISSTASSASQTSATTSATAAASPTGNSASVISSDVLLGGLGSLAIMVAYWVGLV